MSDYRHPSPYNVEDMQCTGKVSFPTWYAAERVAHARFKTSKRKRQRTHSPREIYRCAYCHQFHIARRGG
jgi:hypothetical protein